MSGLIRPLREADLGALSTLYAELDKRDPALPAPGYAEFFRRVLLTAPLVDPEIPSLVFEDPDDGVVGVLGAHARPFRLGGRPVKIACGGPMVVRQDYRVRGAGALMLRRFAAGPQDATINDRMVDEVREMWTLMGGSLDAISSVGWAKTLTPAGAGIAAVARRFGRSRVPVIRLASLGAPRARRRAKQPPGALEPLDAAGLGRVLDGLGKRFPLRPDYDESFLAALTGAMETAILGELVARVVRTEDGKDAGAFVLYAKPGGLAEVLSVIAAPRRAGLVIDHLIATARERGAVEVRGRLEAHLYPHLRERGCRLAPDCWTLVHSKDADLVEAVRSGGSLFSRFDGEWWMRPSPEAGRVPA